MAALALTSLTACLPVDTNWAGVDDEGRVVVENCGRYIAGITVRDNATGALLWDAHLNPGPEHPYDDVGHLVIGELPNDSWFETQPYDPTSTRGSWVFVVESVRAEWELYQSDALVVDLADLQPGTLARNWEGPRNTGSFQRWVCEGDMTVVGNLALLAMGALVATGAVVLSIRWFTRSRRSRQLPPPWPPPTG